MKSKLYRIGISLLLLTQVSCGNVFVGGADKGADAAILFEMEKNLNSRAYDAAILNYGQLRSATQARRDVQLLLADAYAGKCGLDVIQLANAIQNGSGSTFQRVYSQFRSTSSTTLSDCNTAEDIILHINPLATGRTNVENAVLIFLSFAKLGVIIDTTGDIAPNDGTLDGGYDPCTSGWSLSQAEAAVYSFSILKESLTAYPSGSALIDSARTAINAMCTALTGAGYPTCDTLRYDSSMIIQTPTANAKMGARAIVSQLPSLLVGVGTQAGAITTYVGTCSGT